MLDITTFVGAISIISVFFGVAWTMTNFYTYYPVVQAGVSRVVTGTRTSDASFVGTDMLSMNKISEYPEIDVLVPGYQEQDVIHQAIMSIRETEYPQDKINLTVLLEPGDEKTIQRVRSIQTDVKLSLLTVPSAYPDSPNKPRALNYGFEMTDAEIVGVIDAENVVSKDLFSRVVKAVVIEECDYVQGIVDMANEDDGWKNLLFRAEYGYWYRFIVPAFKRLGFPIPLSGTTCFFKRSVLEEVSTLRRERKGTRWDSADKSWLADHNLSGITPWDANNVTEDFELGLFLWVTDYDFGLINSVTKEESPQTFNNWIKQRTRWQKGKIYTFIDFFRHPVGSSTDRSHLLWQSFLPHIGPLNVIGVTLLVIIGTAVQFTPELLLVVGVLSLSFAFFIVGLLSFGVGYWLVSTKSTVKKLLRLIIILLTVPLYWLMQWGADIRAFKQLYSGDLRWEKTIHKDSNRLEALQNSGDEATISVRKLLWNTITSHKLLFPVLLLGLVLRIPGITRSLWIDEIYSVTVRGSMNLFGLITTSSDPHPPVYYLVLKGWMFLFGNSPVAVRSLSVLFGVGAIGAVYMLADELYDNRIGLIAALLMSISTFNIQYSQTARMYSMLVFFSALSTYFYILLIRNHNLDNRFGYIVTTLLMLMVHIYGSFILLAQLLHLGARVVTNRDIQTAKRWSVTQMFASGLFLPWAGLIAAPNYLFGDGTEVRWLGEPTLQLLRDILLAYSGLPVNYPKINFNSLTFTIGSLVGVIILGSLLWQLYSEREIKSQIQRSVLLLALLVSTVVVPFIISMAVIPLLEVRYTIVGFITIAIILAKTISDISYRPARLAALILIVLIFTATIPMYYTATPSEGWDQSTKIIEDDLGDNSLIVFNPGYSENAVNYYLSEDSQSVADTTRFQSEQALSDQIVAEEYEQIWIVNIRPENLGEARQSLPSVYNLERSESVQSTTIFEYQRNMTQTTTDIKAEVER